MDDECAANFARQSATTCAYKRHNVHKGLLLYIWEPCPWFFGKATMIICNIINVAQSLFWLYSQILFKGQGLQCNITNLRLCSLHCRHGWSRFTCKQIIVHYDSNSIRSKSRLQHQYYVCQHVYFQFPCNHLLFHVFINSNDDDQRFVLITQVNYKTISQRALWPVHCCELNFSFDRTTLHFSWELVDLLEEFLLSCGLLQNTCNHGLPT